MEVFKHSKITKVSKPFHAATSLHLSADRWLTCCDCCSHFTLRHIYSYHG